MSKKEKGFVEEHHVEVESKPKKKQEEPVQAPVVEEKKWEGHPSRDFHTPIK